MSSQTVYPPQNSPASGIRASGSVVYNIAIGAPATVASLITVFSTSAA